jgi:hypothetical protein
MIGLSGKDNLQDVSGIPISRLIILRCWGKFPSDLVNIKTFVFFAYFSLRCGKQRSNRKEPKVFRKVR